VFVEKNKLYNSYSNLGVTIYYFIFKLTSRTDLLKMMLNRWEDDIKPVVLEKGVIMGAVQSKWYGTGILKLILDR